MFIGDPKKLKEAVNSSNVANQGHEFYV